MTVVSTKAPLDWDILRIFLAVNESGSVNAAAADLGVNPSTVSRRIKRLEEILGVSVFDRLATGYVLNEAGQEILTIAQRVDKEMAELRVLVSGRDSSLAGPVRITVSDWLFQYGVQEHLELFRQSYPDIVLELVVGDSILDLSRRDADVAFRVTRTPHPTLVGRRVGLLKFAGYASRNYLANGQVFQDGGQHLSWIGEDDGESIPKELGERYPNAKLSIRTNTVLATVAAIKSGYGVGRLPSLIASWEPDLVKVYGPIDTQAELWVLTHERLRKVARVSAVLNFFSERIL